MNNFPPNISPEDKVILYDGVCCLCNASVNFVIRHDKAATFKFLSMQSEKGQEVLQYFGFPLEEFSTVLYVTGDVVYTKSTAFIEIMRLLPYPVRALSWFRVIPVPVRDYIYDRVANNRYRIFGKHETCLLPDDDIKNRFL